MNYVIIENEFFALESLKNLVSTARKDYKLVYTSESVEDAVIYFSKKPNIDLVFMDIELVDGNCFEIFKKVEIEIPIIFTTAYSEFAIHAFKVNSLDYLLKPLSEQTVLSAIEKFEKFKPDNRIKQNYSLLSDFINSKKKRRVQITKQEEYFFVETDDIAYFLSEEKYVFLITFSGKKYITNYVNLNQVEEDLNLNEFFRLTRNLIVHIKSVSKVTKHFGNRLNVSIKTDRESIQLLVSAARKDSFFRWLEGK